MSVADAGKSSRVENSRWRWKAVSTERDSVSVVKYVVNSVRKGSPAETRRGRV